MVVISKEVPNAHLLWYWRGSLLTKRSTVLDFRKKEVFGGSGELLFVWFVTNVMQSRRAVMVAHFIHDRWGRGLSRAVSLSRWLKLVGERTLVRYIRGGCWVRGSWSAYYLCIERADGGAWFFCSLEPYVWYSFCVASLLGVMSGWCTAVSSCAWGVEVMGSWSQ